MDPLLQDLLPPQIMKRPKKRTFKVSNQYVRNYQQAVPTIYLNNRDSFVLRNTQRMTTEKELGDIWLNANRENNGLKLALPDLPKATIKETTIDNKFVGPGISRHAQGLGYLNKNYKAKTTHKQLITDRLAKDYFRTTGPMGNKKNSGKESIVLTHGKNKTFSEKMNSRALFKTIFPQIINSKEMIGKFRLKNGDTSHIPNNRFEPQMLTSQLQQNPFHISGQHVNPFIG